MHPRILTVLVGLLCITLTSAYSHAARVLELSDRFLDLRSEGVWLVMFYAPWCGHCKKLEPIFSHVAQALHDDPIRVGRIDCTRFNSVAHEFKIGGYPTILLIKGQLVHSYRGDRTSTEIVAYARRMIHDPIQVVENLKEVDDEILFGYVGVGEGELWEAFSAAATLFQPQTQFFHLNQLEGEPTPPPFIFLHKITQDFIFPPTGLNITASLIKWISTHRWPEWLKITPFNFQELTGKLVAMAVVHEDKLGRVGEGEGRFSSLLQSLTPKYTTIQFGYVGNPELPNSIAMQTLTIPSLIVVNATTLEYFTPEEGEMNEISMSAFLDSVLRGEVGPSGGRSYPTQMYRTFYEAKTSLVDMWIGNPVLTTILFGLPLAFLSLIFYSICCADMMVDEEHEKNE